MNDGLLALGIVDEPLTLIFNRTVAAATLLVAVSVVLMGLVELLR